MPEAKGVVPELRFPEFRDAGPWERTTIGELGTFSYGKSAPKWSLEDDAPTPCVRYGELYTKFGPIITETYSRTNIDPSNLRFSEGGEILVPRVGEKPQDFGKCCCFLPLSGVAIGEMISVFRTDQNPIFYTYYFRSLYREFAKVVEGQNVKNLYYAELEPLTIYRPSLPEQQKIAACLGSLDDLIRAEEGRLAALRAHKTGLMQRLFPTPGQTTPRLRFPEFEGAGPWEVKRLGEIAITVKERNNGGQENRVLTNSAEFGVVDQRAFFNKDIAVKENLEGYTIVEEDDFVYNPRISATAPVGPISRNKVSRGVMSPLYTVFRFQSGCLDFFEYFFQSSAWHPYLRMVGSTGARHDRLSVSIGDFLDMPIFFPSQREQQKIADCLTALDDLIRAQGETIAALKAHKTGLMQKLFPREAG